MDHFCPFSTYYQFDEWKGELPKSHLWGAKESFEKIGYKEVWKGDPDEMEKEKKSLFYAVSGGHKDKRYKLDFILLQIAEENDRQVYDFLTTDYTVSGYTTKKGKRVGFFISWSLF